MPSVELVRNATYRTLKSSRSRSYFQVPPRPESVAVGVVDERRDRLRGGGAVVVAEAGAHLPVVADQVLDPERPPPRARPLLGEDGVVGRRGVVGDRHRVEARPEHPLDVGLDRPVAAAEGDADGEAGRVGEAHLGRLRRRQGERDRIVDLLGSGEDLDEARLGAVVDRDLVTVGDADREVLGRARQQADVEADPGVGAAVEGQLGDVGRLGEGVGVRDQAARELEAREPHVQTRPHRQAVGELVGDRGVDRPGRDLAVEADVAAGERFGVVPLRPDPERPAHAQADHRLLAELLRVVERGQDAEAVVRLLEGPGRRVRS